MFQWTHLPVVILVDFYLRTSESVPEPTFLPACFTTDFRRDEDFSRNVLVAWNGDQKLGIQNFRGLIISML